MPTESAYHHGDLRHALVRAALDMLEVGDREAVRDRVRSSYRALTGL